MKLYTFVVLYLQMCMNEYGCCPTYLWFSKGTPFSSNNKADCYVIAEILMKVVLNTITLELAQKIKPSVCSSVTSIRPSVCLSMYLVSATPPKPLIGFL
jgi:hypothetical protein